MRWLDTVAVAEEAVVDMVGAEDEGEAVAAVTPGLTLPQSLAVAVGSVQWKAEAG